MNTSFFSTYSIPRNTLILGVKSNHLGNVLNVITDRKLPINNIATNKVDYYTADVVAYNDYMPFGALMEGRHGYDGKKGRHGFNSKEQDDEIKGEGNSLDFGARMYDPRLSRLLSIDPREKEFPSFSPYCYAANNPIKFIDVNGEGPGDPVRLYIASANNHEASHSEAFFASAKDLQQEHGGKYGWAGVHKIRKAYSGTDIIAHINGQQDGSIKSLDLFSHSNWQGIWFYHNTENSVKVKDVKSGGVVVFQQDKEYNGLYQNEELYENEPGIRKNCLQLSYAKTFNDIDVGKFANDARIEFHGCETAGSLGDVDKLSNNICIDLSKKLYEAGKLNAVVIGHTGQSSPMEGTNDYRHGVRFVYSNGNLVLKTEQVGEISQEQINKAIENFSKTGNTTDITSAKAAD